MGDGETVRRMPLGEGGRKKGDDVRRSVSLSLSVSPSPLDEAVIQPIKEAPQVANQAASGASFGRRRRTCRTCAAREKRKTGRNLNPTSDRIERMRFKWKPLAVQSEPSISLFAPQR